MYIEQSVFLINPWWEGGGFFTNISVGTPPQVITATIDLWESGTFIVASNYTQCQVQPPCFDGYFNATSSSTSITDAVDTFNTTWAAGNLISDVLQIGPLAIAGIQVELTTSGGDIAYYQAGDLGLGYPVSVVDVTQSPVSGLLPQLKQAGAIASELFSLYLGDVGTTTGSIIFGGIDLCKFTGELVTLDVISRPLTLSDNTRIDTVYTHALAITDISITANNHSSFPVFEHGDPTGQQNDSLPVYFDASDAWWEVPQDIYDIITPFIPNLNASTYIMPCDQEGQNISITIEFGAAVNITVPIGNLAIPIYDSLTGDQNVTSDGLPLCQFALYPGPGSISSLYELGFSVLRSTYLIFDLDNGQISIAQASPSCSTCSEIFTVPIGPDGLKKALASASQPLITASSNGRLDLCIISATHVATRSFSVWTTAHVLGQATGTQAVPEVAISYPANVLSTGTLSSGVTLSAQTATPTNITSGTSTHTAEAKGAAVNSADIQRTIFLAVFYIVLGWASG